MDYRDCLGGADFRLGNLRQVPRMPFIVTAAVFGAHFSSFWAKGTRHPGLEVEIIEDLKSSSLLPDATRSSISWKSWTVSKRLPSVRSCTRITSGFTSSEQHSQRAVSGPVWIFGPSSSGLVTVIWRARCDSLSRAGAKRSTKRLTGSSRSTGRIQRMDPITVTSALTVAKTAGEISKRLYDLGKSLKDREAQRKVDEILESVRELKQSAAEQEDVIREQREKLRFKSDEYKFRTPFYYHKDHPDQPLCAKCFASYTVGPMGEQGRVVRDTIASALFVTMEFRWIKPFAVLSL